MSEILPKNAGISPANTAEVTKMTAIAEAQYLIRDIAGPVQGFAQVQQMLIAVARASGLGHRRLRGIWNNEARAIRAEELDALRRAAVARRQTAQEAIDRDQFQVLSERLAFLEQRMAAIDPQPARAAVDADSRAANALGCVDRALATERKALAAKAAGASDVAPGAGR